jgi:hypothetical protein
VRPKATTPSAARPRRARTRTRTRARRGRKNTMKTKPTARRATQAVARLPVVVPSTEVLEETPCCSLPAPP